jgi:dTDP-glucose 4,6-dehydratase
MVSNVLITGGCGFIGSNFILQLLAKYPSIRITNVDALTYAGNLENLKSIEHDTRYRFRKASIENLEVMQAIFTEVKPDVVVHFAAESHVDRSISDGRPFIISNVLGTQTLLDCAKAHGVSKFVHVSTDEVYGTLGEEGVFTEETPLTPNSPYSASKAGSDLVVRAYYETFHMPCVITRCSNNYGPYQFPEKLIPLMISKASQNLPLPVYGNGLNVRDWIHVSDHCHGVELAMLYGKPGEVYNLGGESERRNIDIVTQILKIMKKPSSLITYVQDRPGHDFRYAMGIDKARRELGFEPKYTFENGLKETVEWYLSQQEWLESITSGEYHHYYDKHYGGQR